MDKDELSIDEMRSRLNEAPAPEPAKKPAPEAEEPEQKAEGPQPAEQATSGDAEKKVPDSVQKRINKAIWEKHEASRQAEAARKELAELKSQLGGKEEAPAAPTPPAKPSAENYDTIEELLEAQTQYVLDMVTHKNRQMAEEAKTAEARSRFEAEQQKLAREYTERLHATAQKHPEVMEIASGPLGEFLSAKLPEHADAIRRSPVGPEILLYMSNHADELMGVVETGSPVEVAKYIGRIEAGLTTRDSKRSTLSPSGLPAPPRMAGGQVNAQFGSSDLSEDMSTAEWIKEARRRLTASG